MLEGEVGRTEVLVSWQRSYHRLWDQLSRVGPAKPPPTPQLPWPVPSCPTAQAVPSQRDPAVPRTQPTAILGLLSSSV